jgi:hypothetical protein
VRELRLPACVVDDESRKLRGDQRAFAIVQLQPCAVDGEGWQLRARGLLRCGLLRCERAGFARARARARVEPAQLVEPELDLDARGAHLLDRCARVRQRSQPAQLDLERTEPGDGDSARGALDRYVIEAEASELSRAQAGFPLEAERLEPIAQAGLGEQRHRNPQRDEQVQHRRQRDQNPAPAPEPGELEGQRAIEGGQAHSPPTLSPNWLRIQRPDAAKAAICPHRSATSGRIHRLGTQARRARGRMAAARGRMAAARGRAAR